MGSDPEDGSSPAPIDRSILEDIRDRLETSRQFEEAIITDQDGHLRLSAPLSQAYYPNDIIEASLEVRWYTNDDFKVQYHETWTDHRWECRWDRHPNPHNTRDHFHPPPDASTPGTDESWPSDYRDVMHLVLTEIEQRIDDLWD